MPQTDDVVIKTIRKNSREEIRISCGPYMGYQTIRQWVWYLDGDGWRPGKTGLAFRVELIDEIMEGLALAKAALVKEPAE
jgi:hypothetical protein